jgi:hypothetical protein
MVRDFCIDQRFRCDVFARDASPLTASKQRERLMSSGLALVRPPAAITYEMPTPAGRVRYDNAAARAIIASLMSGVRCLADIPSGFATARDLIANMLVLCAAGDVRPTETTRTPVGPLNRALRRRLGKAEEVPAVALPCGTALDIDQELLNLLSGAGSGGMRSDWREFLELHGV